MSDEAVAEAEPEVVEDETAEAEAETVEAEATEESESEGTEEVTASQEDEPGESSTPKKDSVQERMDELTRRFYQERQRAEAAEAQLNQNQPEPVQPGKTLADFEYDEGAYAQYVKDLAKQEAQAEYEVNQRQAQEQKVRSDFESKEAAFARENPDYYSVAHYSPITPEVGMTVMQAEKAPELAYYLGKNPDIAMQISQLPPLQMAMELGRIQATALVPPPPAPKKEIPEPPPQIAAKGSPTKVDPSTSAGDRLSDAEWLKRRNKQLANRS